MTAPAPDLPAVTLTDEERGLIAGTIDSCTVWETVEAVEETVERIVAARLAAQPVAPAPDRDALAEALRDVFRGDEYEENAAAAAGEGEWSWFAWLAATAGVDAVLDALAARPAPSGDADLAARVQELADEWDAPYDIGAFSTPDAYEEAVRDCAARLRALLADQPAATPEGGASDG
ncbi:hypothetical protein INN71_02560 [Nocardioides sp. ChNu-153]|uniref:hypothetical protein n=1 Tax=Nocardioides sp. ChNu-153 TaxID=2779364 RepID=UPI0026554FFC|nr:hypothetical protein [Nocardioides sp. ChNu-153]MDN7120267.1 hypothetical protein [Nocardioides sp. ChNu-153]